MFSNRPERKRPRHSARPEADLQNESQLHDDSDVADPRPSPLISGLDMGILPSLLGGAHAAHDVEGEEPTSGSSGDGPLEETESLEDDREATPSHKHGRNSHDVLLATTPNVPGRSISRTLGLVKYVGHLGGDGEGFFLGLDHLRQRGAEMGADGIIGITFTAVPGMGGYSSFGKIIIAGTAVQLDASS